MADRRTASYAAVPLTGRRFLERASTLGPEVLRGIVADLQAAHPLLCRCADPQSVIVSTGPVLCRTCGRRIDSR